MSKLRESKLVSMVATGVVAALSVAVVTLATTISTNITTGGTLTVSGASTLSSTLGVTATSTFTGDARFNKGVGVGADNSIANTILISGLSSAPDTSEGRLYYDSSAKLLKLYDGTQWASVATSTGGSGIDVSGSRIQLHNLSSYLTIGTTTQQGLSMLTLESTSTAGIPLTIVGYNGQTANTLQVRNSSSVNLFYVDANGGLVSFASSTIASNLHIGGQLNASSTLTVDGASLLNGNVTLGDAAADNIILTGNASTTNSLKVGNVLYVGGYATTSGTTGNIQSAGSIVASTTSTTLHGIGVATSTPAAEFAAGGYSTTTVYLTSTGTNTGGCLQLLGTNGTFYRMYLTPGDAGSATTTLGGKTGYIAVWEAGACK